MNILMIIYIFALIGVFFVGIGVHEGFHALVSDELRSVCLDFGKDMALAHVEVIDDTPIGFEETKAFSIQMALTILLTIGMTKVYMEKRDEK